MKEKMVCYTAIFGGKDDLLDPPGASDDCDFVCFTDDPSIESKIYDVRLCKRLFSDPTRDARRYKLLPHLFLPDYKYSLWIDGCVTLNPVNLDEFRNQLSDGTDIILFKHPVRDCVYDEVKACISLKKDSPRTMLKQVEKYRREGYPSHNGLCVSTIMFRRHMSPALIKFDEAWWEEVCKYSRRDQLSFNYLTWKYNLPYETFSGKGEIRDNVYCKWGIHKIKDSWRKPWFKLLMRH
jgi:hypothetical protein